MWPLCRAPQPRWPLLSARVAVVDVEADDLCAFRRPLPWRRWPRTTLTCRGLPRELIEDAALIVSQLVTNAVQHANPILLPRSPSGLLAPP